MTDPTSNILGAKSRKDFEDLLKRIEDYVQVADSTEVDKEFDKPGNRTATGIEAMRQESLAPRAPGTHENAATWEYPLATSREDDDE
jgi:hypothetical protein